MISHHIPIAQQDILRLLVIEFSSQPCTLYFASIAWLISSEIYVLFLKPLCRLMLQLWFNAVLPTWKVHCATSHKLVVSLWGWWGRGSISKQLQDCVIHSGTKEQAMHTQNLFFFNSICSDELVSLHNVLESKLHQQPFASNVLCTVFHDTCCMAKHMVSHRRYDV